MDSVFAERLRSLQRVADVTDGDVTPDSYRAARRQLIAAGEEIDELNAVIRYFGTWRATKEALGLAEVATPRLIEARFRGRLIGKPHRYRDETLLEIVRRCAAEVGHPPLVIEFEHWRYRELELAKSRGESLFLPSSSPYRRRWATWENALRAAGFSDDEVAGRLEPGRERSNESRARFQFR